MFRKKYISLFILVALFLFGGISTFAQQMVGGKVLLKKEDGTKTPVEGAKIDCYRIDINQSCRTVTTDSKGAFTIIGLPVGAKIVLAISGPGLAPQVTPNIRMDDSNSIEAKEGDGSVLSEEETRQIASTYAADKGELTDAQKAELAEIEKKRAEIEANNAKIEQKNKLRVQYLSEGNEAFNKKDWAMAAAKFDEGYKIDPEYLGSAPVFLNNRAQALKQHAVENYNAAVKSKDASLINKAKAEVVVDFTNALDSTYKAYLMSKNAKPDAIVNAAKTKEDIKNSEDIVKELFRIMGIINVNLASNLATEEDATKAVSIYQGSLKMLPDNPDVLAGLAMALFSSSDFKGSKQEKKESLDTWYLYKKVAPKDHGQQATADGMIEFLKEEVK